MKQLSISIFLSSCAFVSGAFAQAPGAHWSTTPTPSDPPLRIENPGVSDGTHMYVFGGNAGSSVLLNDLWRFDGATWTLMTATGAASSPPERFRSGITWDAFRNRLVVFGGRDSSGTLLGDIWEWDPGTNTWADVTPTGTSPSPREFSALAFDLTGGRVLLHAGLDATGAHLNDTWHFDGVAWTQLAPSTLPPVRRQHVMVERPEFQDVIMCGGQEAGGAGMRADTWRWDGFDWTQIVTTTPPSGKVAIDAAYDQIRQRIVIASGNPGPTGTISEFDSLSNDWIIRPLDRGIFKVTRYFMAYVPALGKTYKVSGQALNSTRPPQNTYEYQSDFIAEFSAQGSACPGTAGTPTLSCDGLPWFGETYDVAVGPVGTAPVLMILGLSDTSWSGIPLPLGLGFIGAPGCNLYIGLDFSYPLTAASGAAHWTVPVPSLPYAAGASFYNQAMVYDTGANTLGWIFSDYSTATIAMK